MRGRWYCIDGNVYESVVDLRVPCPNTDLVFRRVYGSWSRDAGTLGYGWTHGYEWHLSVSNGSDRVVVRSAGEGIDNLLAVKIGGNVYYPLTDIQGTVWGYADYSGDVVARWTYDAWGNVLSESCAVPSLASVRYRFQGREWSAATGLINFRMRWYDAETGRWLNKDPIGLSGGLNLYVFCEDDPANGQDALGLWGVWFGTIHVGNDEPWMIFDSSSLDDLKRGVAATADGVLTAATMHGLFGLFDPNLFDSYYDPCDFDTGVSHALGCYSFEMLTVAFSLPQGITRGSSQIVTHWGPAGTAELRSGDWVMTGGASVRNWIMAGAKTSRGGWGSPITTAVPKTSLRYPSGCEWWKGLIGQRVYTP